jgi:hypothetical protein
MPMAGTRSWRERLHSLSWGRRGWVNLVAILRHRSFLSGNNVVMLIEHWVVRFNV